MIRQQRVRSTIHILAFVVLVLLMVLLAGQVDDIAASVMGNSGSLPDDTINWCYSACTFVR